MQTTFNSNLVTVVNQMLGNMDDARMQLKEEAVEWVQYQMLYGYHEPHGADRHTEIYDTGHLSEEGIESDSAKDSQNTFTVVVGTNVPYARYVHEGTYKLHGRPFLRDALEGHAQDIQDICAENLKKGF